MKTSLASTSRRSPQRRLSSMSTSMSASKLTSKLTSKCTWRRRPIAQRGFLLIMVLLVVSIVSLAALNFSESMLIAHETSRLDSQRFQARMMAESGIQVARIFVSETAEVRTEKGGHWDNPQKFQAINVVPNINPVFRGNVSFIAPSLDQNGSINGFRFGLQNESAKLNLNALVQLDKLSKTLSSASGALGGLASAAGGSGAAGTSGTSGGQTSGLTGPSGGTGQSAQASGLGQLTGPGGAGNNRGGGGGGGAFGAAPRTLSTTGAGGSSTSGSGSSSLASGASSSTSLGAKMLLGIPGMTEDVADAILDFMDDDEEARPNGCEYADYYQQLQPAYHPPNGPLTSIEQLLLVRGVTPQLLYGYDHNRNGVLDASEQNQMSMGVQVGGMPGATPASTANTSSNGTQATQPSPLGWAPYLTLHSQEKNVAADGTKRVNINQDDLQTLQSELQAAGVNDLYTSYIIGYRLGGQAPPNAGSPLQTLLTAAATTSTQGGMLGQQLNSLTQSTGQGQSGGQTSAQSGQAGGQAGGQASQQKKVWTSSALGDVDLSTQSGSVKFNQVLDLIGSSVTMGGQGGQSGGQTGQTSGQGQQAGGQGGNTYSSPIEDSPMVLADAMPIIMDKLTTVDSEALPGRINIMECPREILIGMPGLTEEIAQKIIEARSDGSETENRKFETWLAVEGILTTDQMRGLLPLVTCGGDVFKAQVIGYFEGSAAFCRAEVVISGVSATPNVLFFRRLDHLGRGFNVMTLGQRNDVGSMPSMIKR